MELYHQILGSTPGTLNLKVRDEDLHQMILHQTQKLTAEWIRVYVSLPPGVHQVIIEGTRAREGSSGLAIDDIRIEECHLFGL